MMESDAITAFLDAMKAAGVHPVESIGADLGNGLIRFACEGDGKGKRNGWAILHLDGIPAGRSAIIACRYRRSGGQARLSACHQPSAGNGRRNIVAGRQSGKPRYWLGRNRRRSNAGLAGPRPSLLIPLIPIWSASGFPGKGCGRRAIACWCRWSMLEVCSGTFRP